MMVPKDGPLEMAVDPPKQWKPQENHRKMVIFHGD
jgi:hypothetical protein